MNRREALKLAAGSVALTALPGEPFAADERPAGRVEGQPLAAKAGMAMLAAGGNAVDAIVTAALTAAVVAPHQTGPGGYGGCMTLALAGGQKVTAIDFNSAAPAAAKSDMFAPDADGKVQGAINQ